MCLLIEQMLDSMFVVFWLFYQSSVRYKIVDYTIASWICYINLDICLCIFIKVLIWILTARVFLIFLLVYGINFNWLSSQASNHWMVSLLNIIFLFSILILVSRSDLFSRYWYDLEKSTASIFAISYITTFASPNCKTILATFSKIRVISLTKDPKIINPKLSTNKKDVTKRQASKIESKTLFI